uniref:histidine phosphatase family protein n=1 Tax=Eubacterium cellulosolvens TaxID=29322 RepID=UPI000A8B3BC5|nr:histidine phosphatase family protein [[Eubacterium] cellulosolvens]
MYNKRKVMHIVLIRHGQTAGNLEKRYVGRTDEPILPEAAVSLAKRRESILREECEQAVFLFSSPMKRCVQTAELLCPTLAPHLLEDFRECDFGRFEYKNYRELAGDADYQKWIDSMGTRSFPGGESREEFSLRCCNAFRKAIQTGLREHAEHLFFVVHGGTIMSILEKWAVPKRSYYDWQCGNGCGFSADLYLTGPEDPEPDFCLEITSNFT